MSRDGEGRLSSFLVGVVLVGVAAGLAGALVTVVLHLVQHLAYGYQRGSFLVAVEATQPGVRVAVLAAAGLLGGVGWWTLRRFGRPVVDVEDAVAGVRFPLGSTVWSVLLQLVVVGLGASIGRELAPRVLAALAAERIARPVWFSPERRRLLVACGAGAGLAAVYNVPLGGALFVLEVLLIEVRVWTVVAAVVTSGIATLVARIVVPPTPLYSVVAAGMTPEAYLWVVVAGVALGMAGVGFDALVRRARRSRPTPGWQLVVMPVTFLLVGVAAAYQPTVLGNGRALAQVVFDSVMPVGTLVLLALLKALATTGTIFSGADGGTLTPSVSIGAALGAAAGSPFLALLPGLSAVECAVVGAAAFLAATMRAPVTAAVLVLEFTGTQPSLILPVVVAVAGATCTGLLIRGRMGRQPRAAGQTGVDGG